MLRHTLLVAIFMHACSAVSAESTSREETFQKGLAAYQHQKYAEAREAFQQLLDQNTQNGTVSVGVLHNLALSALQLDQKAWALAFWRKALSVRPSFGPARAGRDLIESKNQMRPYERDSLSLWYHRQLESLSFYEMLALNAVLLGFTGWLFIRYYGKRRFALDSESPLPPFPSIAVVLSVFFVGSCLLLAFKVMDMESGRATIVAAKASVRSLPSDDGAGLFDIAAGNEVLVKRQEKGWVQVQSSDGNSGWVKDTDIFVTSGH